MTAKVINLWAGPGAGKSTTASALFSLMKGEGHKVELVTEYAKDLTYEGGGSRLSNQWLVTGEQDQRLRRLVDQVDFIITDSPLPLSLVYVSGPFARPWFRRAVLSLFETYDNVNFQIVRAKAYQAFGRSQTEEEARVKDEELIKLLGELGGPKRAVKGGRLAASLIYAELFPDA